MVIQSLSSNELAPISDKEYAAFLEGSDPEPSLITEHTRVIAIPIPEAGGGIVSSTLCYVLSEPNGAAHIIDPGWDTDHNFELLTSHLKAWGIDRVETIVATHMHPDHLGMAERLRREYGAAVAISRQEWDSVKLDTFTTRDRYLDLDNWGVPISERPELGPVQNMFEGWNEPDVLLDDDDVINLGRDIKVILTPGHSQGGITLVDNDNRLIFPGDQVMPHRNPGLGFGYLDDANPVGDFLESSEKLMPFDGYQVCTGHGYRFGELALRIRQHIGHHLRRTRQTAIILGDNPEATVWEIARQLHWSGGWERLEGYFIYSALSQTAMHRNFVTDNTRSEGWLQSEY